MTYIITRADYKYFNTKGVTASQVLDRAGDAMKTGGLPNSSVLALSQQGQTTRMEHFAKTGSASARSGMQKTASDIGAMTGGSWVGSQIAYTSPSFYSPLHTATNWQIPTRRRECYIWARFFAQNDPTIKSSLRFYSQFPFHGYEHVMSDPIRKEHFDGLKKRLRLEHLLPQLAYEYFTMGDAFPFISFQCASCGGFGTTQDGSICNHDGGRIANVTVMNPDWIDVQINPLMPNDPVINLIPDDTLKQIVWSKKPPEIYDKIPERLRALIMKQQPIPISNRAITHLKHDEIPYMAYGNSIIASLFPILAYQDRLRQAQWIVAERHILPIKICKVGSDTRPASSADIADTQRQLAMSANDPNVTLVTHHSFDLEWVGAAGKILQLTKEYELIDKCLIKGLGVNEALLSGEGPSYTTDINTLILTQRGFVECDDFDEEKDLVATFNKESGALEYQKVEEKYVYDWDSIDGDHPDLYHYKTNRIDFMCTPNHRMLIKTRQNNEKNIDQWDVVLADDVKNRSVFRGSIDKWEGRIPPKTHLNEMTMGIDLETFLEFVGMFISEGYYEKSCICPELYESHIHINGQKRTNKPKKAVSFTQNQDSEAFELCCSIYNRVNICKKSRNNSVLKSGKLHERFIFYSEELSEMFNYHFGEYCENKKIPIWMKDLPTEYLEILLHSLVAGDGSVRDATKKKETDKNYYTYHTTSKQLRDDIMEIVIKLGRSPRFSLKPPANENRQDIWIINWSDADVGLFPTLQSKDYKTNQDKQVIFRQPYKGRVWCVRVKNSFFITQRNGLIAIHGNSQAAIGIEATIKRLKTVQSMMAEWICEKIYRVEAMMQGFYKKDLSGNQILDYPSIRWADLNLRDETQKQQLYMQMWDKQLVSTQFIHEKFDIDHETEVERVRMEQSYQMQLGIAPQGGEAGGMGGGLGGGKPGGGGLGGGFKGNLPGGQSGPGLPGDAHAPSMSGGGGGVAGTPSAAPGGPMGAYETQMVNYNQAQQYAPSISRKSRIQEPKKPKEPKPDITVEGGGLIEVPRSGANSLTDIEIKLYSKVEEAQKQGHLPLEFLWQQNPEPNDPETSRITADGMFPAIRLIVEADGKKWHSSPEDVQRDTERDGKLMARGWSILRFTEDEIQYSIDEVIKKIIRSAEDMMGYGQETDVQRVAKKCFASGGYSSDLSYKEKINQYKKEELANRIMKEGQKNKEKNKMKQAEVLSEYTVETRPEIKEESTEESVPKLNRVNAGHDLSEENEKIVDDAFLKTSQTYEGEETRKIDEVISEDLSDGEEEIIPEQENLQNLIK